MNYFIPIGRISKSGCFLVAALITQVLAKGASPVSFNRDIRPILSENCYACHGPDANTREAGLRLDVEEWAFRERGEGGRPAIVPGNQENSPLYQRITHHLKSEVMPPPDSNKVLSGEQKQLIGQWIGEGAKWEGHWAFMKPETPLIPDSKWGNNEIDKFTYKAMKERGLSPNEEADRPTLTRRLALDLTGLSPTPEMVESFVSDQSVNAYENLVDKLLASTAYGEHQARYWLDAARYADTHGLHLDNYREIWPYRDWVVRSFNANQPFDQFTVEQIAGDLLPNPSIDQKLATGFNRCNPTTSEGGAIDAEYRAIYAKDRVETAATVFMGMTMGCASCHDHKFDPLTMKDFYQFSAFFSNLDGPIMDGNAYDTRPNVVIPRPQHVEQWPAVHARKRALDQAMSKIKKDTNEAYLTWQNQEEVTFEGSSENQQLAFELRFDENKKDSTKRQALSGHQVKSAQTGDLLNLTEARFEFDPNKPFTIAVSVKLPAEGPQKLVRIPIIEQFDGNSGWRLSVANTDPTFPTRYQISFDLVSSLKDNNLISATAKSERANPREYSDSTIYVNYDGSGSVGGLSIYSGSRQPYDYSKVIDNLTGNIKTDAPLMAGTYPTGLIRQEQASQKYKTGSYDKSANEPKTGYLKNIKFYKRKMHSFELEAINAARLKTILKIPVERRRGRDASQLEAHYYNQMVPEYRKLSYEKAVNDIAYNHIYDQATISLVMAEKNTKPSAHMLSRGEYDKPGDKVFADIPKFFGRLPEGMPKNRMGLAQWIVNTENPLTSRVTVNRFWQNFFGTGIVATSEDFGMMGENPSHPELLDWLAIYFQQTGWDVKNLVKMIVMSATYRQDSHFDPEELAIDRENRYLARGPRYRLDGEVLRDKTLFVGGRLNPRVGGPPVRPYQPDGIWNAVAYSDSNTAHFKQDHGDALYRRSLYTFWKRTAPPPNMMVFDVPSRENCNVRRERTNTPLQALTLMNDPQYVEAARQLAERVILGNSDPPNEQIKKMYTFAFGSAPQEKHHEILSESYDNFLSSFKESPKDAQNLIEVGDSYPDPSLDAVKLASMTMVANQIMNLDSFISKF